MKKYVRSWDICTILVYPICKYDDDVINMADCYQISEIHNILSI